ncbi:NAD-binding protein [Pseudomonas guariconensis]|uniref:oxidoreductase n=1 Tax=Pseudomonas TaxID=286 RepID=UPI0020973D7D|nr:MULTISPECIES: NAD-binding protein [Pseudomonas]MCO7641150.1 NAD-binding protein [Pseudomonas sp. S 311-6]MCO7515432.1 NAD-binding protein [Pseudomonas putida]MCO7566493.1 NAD-binding protein [Pseudomonas mosselii]MCO7596525.1 NAD-binding protein [Pseudomonas guariconensis]MCO7605447.1 NAD-binding protein [Pseudomonas guariconensis]
MTTKYRLTQSPLNIGPVTIPNRLVRTAHATLFSRGQVNEAHIDYHLERARGGVGLTILEGVSVHRSSCFSLSLADDSGIEPLRKLVEAIQPTGMKLFQQLWHGGNVEPAPNGGPPWSVTNLPGRYARMPPVAMSTRQIAELVRAYGAAAARLAKAGIEGGEVLAGAGYLISQFLSPTLNTRTDAYGGCFENRMRFLVELLTDIRESAPSTFALGVRMGASSDPSILSAAEVNAGILYLQAKGLIDFVNIAQGDYYFHVERYAAMDRPVAYQLDVAREVSKGVTVPRIVVGRFGTLDDVEQTLRSGDAEMVNLVRATIADPCLIQKELEGKALEVRPCIACNQGCIGGLFSGRMSCTVNPVVGYESTLSERLITKVDLPKSVVVVGGGPAGMEAARVAALHGHDVTLVEASSRLGGQINLARHLPKNHGIGDLTNWLEREIYRLGVKVRLSTYVEGSEVLAMHPDVLIVATGSMSSCPESFVQTATPHLKVHIETGANVIMSEELVLGTHGQLGRRAVVFDDIGHYEAIGCCEMLLEHGLDVTYVTRHGSFAPEIDKTGRTQAALRRFYSMGNFRILTSSLLLAIHKEGVEVRPIDGIRPEIIPADCTVLVAYRDPLRTLWDELSEVIPQVYVVGDALSPRDLVGAMREGHLCARAIVDRSIEALWHNM